MVEFSLTEELKKIYEESLHDNIEYIQFIHSENKTMQEIREFHLNEWIAELCRGIIFENKKELSSILQEINYDRSQVERFNELLRRRQSDLIPGDESEVIEST